MACTTGDPHYPSFRQQFLRINGARLFRNDTQKLSALPKFHAWTTNIPKENSFYPSHMRHFVPVSSASPAMHPIHPVFITTNAQRLRSFLFFSLRLCRKFIAVLTVMSEKRSCSRTVSKRKRTSLIKRYH